MKQGIKRTKPLNKYRSKITKQPKTNNLDYKIDLTLRTINTLFVLSFKNSENNSSRFSFDKYYMPLVEIKDFNVLIDHKSFFDRLAKNV